MLLQIPGLRLFHLLRLLLVLLGIIVTVATLRFESVGDATDRLADNGLKFMPGPPETYYEKSRERVVGHDEPVERMRRHGILIDGEGVVDGGYAWTHYWSGKNTAAGLFSNPAAGGGTGMDQRSRRQNGCFDAIFEMDFVVRCVPDWARVMCYCALTMATR